MALSNLWDGLKGVFRISKRMTRRGFGAQMRFRIDGVDYVSLDWSLGGFRLPDFHKELKSGDGISGELRTVGGRKFYPFEARVVRVEEGNTIAFRLTEIPARAFLEMSDH